MTREEAIEHLRTVGLYYSTDHSDPNEEYEILTKDELDAICLAIKALEHPEKNVVAVVPCGDCISRQAMLDAISRIGLCKCGTNEVQAVVECLRAVEALPPVTPRPKTGCISIDDVMSVFDDFMRGEVDENDTETFLEMLKDRAESEE